MGRHWKTCNTATIYCNFRFILAEFQRIKILRKAFGNYQLGFCLCEEWV